MVRLGTAAGDHHVAFRLLGTGQNEFELADLVSRQSHAGQVVSFEIHYDSHLSADSIQPLHRCVAPFIV